jgi:hypothetical protein
MNKFDKVLNEEIDQLQPSSGYVNSLLSARKIVQEAESTLRSARDNLIVAKESLNAHLALEIRKRVPQLNVNLTDGKLNIGYRSKCITACPDLDRNNWAIESNDFGRGFVRGFGHTLPLQEDLGPIAEAMAEYFTGKYKTLQGPGPAPMKTGRPIRQKGKGRPGTGYYA